MWKRLIALSLTFGLAAAAPPVRAQVSCSTHENVAAKLDLEFGESVIGRGLRSETSLYEVWRSAETGSWTIVMVTPDGLACVMASGTAWTEEPPGPAGTSS